MKILALYSIKGGVGKTSAAVNLGFCAAEHGFRTLVWDLDPQAASTYYFRIKAKIKGGSKKLINGKTDLNELIKATDYSNLDLLPADFSNRKLDALLEARSKPARQLKKIVRSLAGDYDYIILDCPPSISWFSEAVFDAADCLLSPVIPTTLSMRTLQQLRHFLEDKGYRIRVYPFFSMADSRKKLHKEIMTSGKNLPYGFLSTIIPHSSEIETMGVERRPLGAYAKNTRARIAYNKLWLEILEHTHD